MLSSETTPPEGAAPGAAPGTLTAHSLPRAAGVAFVLLPPDRIRALARDFGEVAFAQVSRPVVRGDSAEVWVSVTRMERLGPELRSADGFTSGGAGYLVPVVRRGSRWVARPPSVRTMS